MELSITLIQDLTDRKLTLIQGETNSMSYFEPNVPMELNNADYWPLLQKSASQMSRIIAWTWTSCLAYSGNERQSGEVNSLAEQEQKLKTIFIQLLQRQAINTNVYVACGDPELLGQAEQFSTDIRNLILGDNDAVRETKDEDITITLSDVVEQFTGERFAMTEEPSFTKMFIFRVITNSFIGYATYAPDKDGDSPEEDKYILELPYPPRPMLSEVTVTEKELSDWAMNLTPGDSYIPPSAYFPWFLC
jgi:hypothetical protein